MEFKHNEDVAHNALMRKHLKQCSCAWETIPSLCGPVQLRAPWKVLSVTCMCERGEGVPRERERE